MSVCKIHLWIQTCFFQPCSLIANTETCQLLLENKMHWRLFSTCCRVDRPLFGFWPRCSVCQYKFRLHPVRRACVIVTAWFQSGGKNSRKFCFHPSRLFFCLICHSWLYRETGAGPKGRWDRGSRITSVIYWRKAYMKTGRLATETQYTSRGWLEGRTSRVWVGMGWLNTCRSDEGTENRCVSGCGSQVIRLTCCLLI